MKEGGEKEMEVIIPEVLSCARDDIREELHLDAPSRNGADCDIKEDDGVLRVLGAQVPLRRRRRRRHDSRSSRSSSSHQRSVACVCM